MEDRWEKVRQIVREECERIESRIIEVLEKSGATPKSKIKFEGGKWVGITEEQKTAWREAYGSCDVEGELKRMAAWIVSNPSQAPKSQFGRFINAWLSREQTRSSIRAIPTRSEQKLRVCAWCTRPSSGMTNGYEHCGLHGANALYGEPPMEKSA